MPEKIKEVLADVASTQKKLEKTAEEIRSETRQMKVGAKCPPAPLPSMGAA